MRRDMDLCRKILLAIEEKGDPAGGWIEDLGIDGYEADIISAHIQLLDEKGLIEAIDLSSASSFELKAERLTDDGHEFLDHARDETIWNKAKQIVLEKAGSLSLDVLITVLKNIF